MNERKHNIWVQITRTYSRPDLCECLVRSHVNEAWYQSGSGYILKLRYSEPAVIKLASQRGKNGLANRINILFPTKKL